MPASYYDKLGDLLSEVLETGDIPPSSPKASAKKAATQDEGRAEAAQKPQTIISEREKQAFKNLSIPEDTDEAAARSIYRKKLQRFHPDKLGDNAILQTVARKKTAQFIESWAILEQYYKREKS